MTHIEFNLPPTADFASAAHVIESCCKAESLTITMKSTLTKYPGSLHWHCKNGRERGTLEITLWPAQRRLWFSVHAGRRGVWIEETIERLSLRMKRVFG